MKQIIRIEKKYDCTHDNPTVLEKFQTGRMALPHIGLLSLADISIASTWG